MSTFVTLEQVKDILGICDSSDDARIGVILDGVIESVFDKVGNLEKGSKIELIDRNQNIVKQGFLPLSYGPINSLTTVDGIDFSSMTNGVDYQILENGTVQIMRLSSLITTQFNSFQVIYDAGYAKAPDDLVDIVATMVGLKYSQDLGKDIIEEGTGPRNVKWSDPTKAQGGAQSVKIAINSRLRKYIPLHLRVY